MNTVLLLKSRFMAHVDSFDFSKVERIGIVFIIGALFVNLIMGVYLTKSVFFNSVIPIASATSRLNLSEISQDKYSYGLATEQFMRTLESSGLNPALADKMSRPQFTGSGRIITLENDNIQVFEYPDSVSAGVESSLFIQKYYDKAYLAYWRDKIHLYTSENMAVFYLGDNEKILTALAQNGSLSAVSPSKPSETLTKINK